MNTAPVLLGFVLAATCSALPSVELLRSAENETHLNFLNHLNHLKQPRIPDFKKVEQLRSAENETDLSNLKQPRIPDFNLLNIGNQRNMKIQCSEETQKVTLGYGEYVTFQSPNYPEIYPKKTTCAWEFKSMDDEEGVTIYCGSFEVENAKKCKNDVLKIDSKKYCGSEEYIYYEGDKDIQVQFTSNKKKNYVGFKCMAYVYNFINTAPPPTPTPAETTEIPATGNPNEDCTCGQANQKTRIVGGKETEENEYPWQAAMAYYGYAVVFCGGSVIGSKHILTAAHCTQAVTDYGTKYQILVGAHSLTYFAPSHLVFNPANIIQHPDYNAGTLHNDISIIVLEEHISFTNSDVRPVCLPTNDDDDYDDVKATVSGWGALEEGGDQPDVLMDVKVPTMTNAKCQEYYGDYIIDIHLCAGYEKGKKDSCQGDSGGPLSYNSGSGYTQIGVVSWGVGCAQPMKPGVYARVSKYLDWIAEKTRSSNKCPAA